MFKPLKLAPKKPKPAHYLAPITEPLVRAARLNEDISPIVLSIAKSLGFDGFLYGASLGLQPVSETRQFIFSTWPADLFPVYDERRYVEVDPRIKSLLESVMPLVWDQSTYQGQSEEVDAFMAWLRSYGICSGVTCPLRDMRGRLGALFLSCGVTHLDDARRTTISRNMGDICMFAHCFHELFVNGALDEMLPPPMARGALTTRERECLLLAAQGKTGEDIATLLNLSLRTVQHHFDKLKRKIGADNRQQAIARGLQIGII